MSTQDNAFNIPKPESEANQDFSLQNSDQAQSSQKDFFKPADKHHDVFVSANTLLCLEALQLSKDTPSPAPSKPTPPRLPQSAIDYFNRQGKPGPDGKNIQPSAGDKIQPRAPEKNILVAAQKAANSFNTMVNSLPGEKPLTAKNQEDIHRFLTEFSRIPPEKLQQEINNLVKSLPPTNKLTDKNRRDFNTFLRDVPVIPPEKLQPELDNLLRMMDSGLAKSFETDSTNRWERGIQSRLNRLTDNNNNETAQAKALGVPVDLLRRVRNTVCPTTRTNADGINEPYGSNEWAAEATTLQQAMARLPRLTDGAAGERPIEVLMTEYITRRRNTINLREESARNYNTVRNLNRIPILSRVVYLQYLNTLGELDSERANELRADLTRLHRPPAPPPAKK